MDDQPRCQSCALPLSENYYGSNADGSKNNEFCKFCYEAGKYINPEFTMDQIMHKAVRHMVDELKIPLPEALKASVKYTPNLKRWRKSS